MSLFYVWEYTIGQGISVHCFYLFDNDKLSEFEQCFVLSISIRGRMLSDLCRIFSSQSVMKVIFYVLNETRFSWGQAYVNQDLFWDWPRERKMEQTYCALVWVNMEPFAICCMLMWKLPWWHPVVYHADWLNTIPKLPDWKLERWRELCVCSQISILTCSRYFC